MNLPTNTMMSSPFIDINTSKKREDFIQDLEKLKKQIENLKGAINEKTIELFSVTIILLNRLYETIFSQKLKYNKDIPKDFETNIFIACEEGKLSSVKYLIDEIGLYQADEYNEKGESLLHIATRIGHLPLVSYLIEKGADKEGKDRNGDTPLHYACKFGHLHIVNYLIKDCCVSINPFNNNKETPFITALKNQQNIIEQYFIKKFNYPKNLETNIFIACEEGKLSSVQCLIEKEKVNPDITNENGFSPIHFASRNGHLSIVEYLISKGANIEAKDKYGRTPLHYACQEKHLQIVEYLISNGANIKAKDSFEQTPHLVLLENNDLPSNLEPLLVSSIIEKPKDYESNIFQACKEGKFTSVKWIIEQEKENNINKTDFDKKTPLHYACEKGHLEIAEYLILNGERIDQKDIYEKTALIYGCENGHLPIIEFLLFNGANVETQDKYGRTPLHFACEKGYFSIAEYLISKGANIETKDKYKRTPLWIAMQNGHKQIIQYAIYKCHLPKEYDKALYSSILDKLKDYTLDIFQACKKGKLTNVQYLIEKLNHDPNKKDDNDKTVLYYAYEEDNLPIVEYLISKGANIEVKDKDGATPLHYSCINGHLQITAYLISKGIIIEEKDHIGRTPLHLACSKGHFSIVEYLISKGANIEVRDNNCMSPLHFACKNGHIQIVEYLISKGTNLEAKDKNEKTPLHYVCENGHLPVVEFLISSGANIEAKNSSPNWSALHFASNYGRYDIVKYLISKNADKNAKDKHGKTPYYYAWNDEIRNILK